MSRRINMAGFSLGQMRKLCASGDSEAVRSLQDQIAARYNYLGAGQRTGLMEIVERAILSGIPFPDLVNETWLHASAAQLLGQYKQDWLYTEASDYHDKALEEGLWGGYRKLASRETRAFLRGLVEGIPMFGQQPPTDGSAYAAVSLDRLRVFQPGLRDFAELIAYRVGRKRKPTDDERAAVTFAAEFCGWVDQIVAAERDLFFCFG